MFSIRRLTALLGLVSAMAAVCPLPSAADEALPNAALVETLLLTGRPLAALQYSDKWQGGADKIGVDYRIVDALQDAGLVAAATQLFDRTLARRATLSAPDQLPTIDRGVTAAIAVGKLDAAESMLDGQDCTALSRSCAELVTAFAQQAQLDKARALLPRLPGGLAHDNASADLALAFARAQQLAQADDLIKAIGDTGARDNAQAGIIAWLAANGNAALAKSRAGALDLPALPVNARVTVARAMVWAGDVAGGVATGEAVLASLAGQSDAQATDLDKQLVGLFADAGNFDKAQGIIDAMTDDPAKDEALGVFAAAAAKQNNYPLAKQLLGSIDLAQANPALLRQLREAFAATAHDEASLPDLVAMIGKTTDVPERVKLLRAVAQVRYDDLSAVDADASTASVALASANATIPMFDNGVYQTYSAPGGAMTPPVIAHPPLDDSVERLRALAPLPGDGEVFLVPASLSPYSGKFLEDLSDAGNGLTPATKAQGVGDAKVVVIHSGVVTLGELVDKLTAAGDFAYVARDGATVTLRAPVLVEPDATLILSGAEASTYRLSATAGSFIAVAGKLFILDTTVTSWDEQTNGPRWLTHDTNTHFRPFIVGWSGSELLLGGSQFLELGYAAPKSFGLSFSSGPKGVLSNNPDLPPPTGIVADNYFENLEYGFYSFEADGVHMVGNEYDKNIVYAIDPHDRSKHLLIALNSTHGSEVKHGIIVSRSVAQSWIVGNLTYDNAGSGIMLDRSSINNLVLANSSFDNRQDGVTIYESACNVIHGNAIRDNDRDGVKIRNSWNVAVAANEITSNAGVGVNAYVAKIEATSGLRDFVMDPYVPFTNFDLADNSIINNGGGLRAAGVAGFSVFGSNFGPQRKRLTSGDLKGLEGYMLQSAASGAAIVSRACVADDPRASCALPIAAREISFGGNGMTTCLPWPNKGATTTVASEAAE